VLTPISEKDDRRRGSRGLVVSVAQKENGALVVSLDRVEASGTTLPNRWDFKVFDGQFEIDPTYLGAVESELARPANERGEEGMGVPDDVLRSIGHAFLIRLIGAAIDARKAGPV
jgi:hypothetical protein